MYPAQSTRFGTPRPRITGLTRILILGSSLCLATEVLGQETRIKHGGFFEGGHTGVSQGPSDTDGLYGVGTYYFQEVRHGALPHSQAAFLERASSITVAGGNLIGDYPFIGKRGVDIRAVDLEYINESHWIVGASYSTFELDGISEIDTTAIRLGRYLGDASRILMSVSDVDTKSWIGGAETNATRYGLEYKNVTVMVDGQAITLDMKYSHLDGDLGNSDEVSLGGEYHLSLATSVNAQVRHAWGQSAGEGFAVGLNHFLTPFLALGASYGKDNTEQQPSSNTVSMFFRFLF